MASVKLRVLGGQGRNNKDELWRNMLVQVETWAQAVPDAVAGEAAKAEGSRTRTRWQGTALTTTKAAATKATQGGSLIEKSLILLSASELRNKDPTY